MLEGRYELKKGGRLGPGPEDCKELTVLNRVLRWTDDGLEYEADPKHRWFLLEKLGLEEDSRKIASNVEKEIRFEEGGDDGLGKE